MVHQDGRGGSLVIDLRLGKLGRLKRASGTQDPKLLADVVRTIRLLRDQYPPRWDVLALLLNGDITPLELHDRYIQGELAQLPTSDELRPLEDMVRRWLRTLDRSSRTVDDYESRLLSLVEDDVRLGALPDLLVARRAVALASGKRRSFNLLLTAARMLVRGTTGERHRLYEALERIEPLRVQRRPGNPQTPDQVRELAGALHQHGPSVWALALSGMRSSEYFGGRWRLLADRIAIAGTKSPAARREAPRIYPIATPTCKGDTLAHLLHEGTAGQVRPHDLRYTYMRWLEEAGVAQIRVNLYAGHAVRNVGELYGRGRGFAEHLLGDAEKVRHWLGEPPATSLRVVEGR